MVFDVTFMVVNNMPNQAMCGEAYQRIQKVHPRPFRLATNSLGPTRIRQTNYLFGGGEREREEKGNFFINCDESGLLSYHMKGEKFSSDACTKNKGNLSGHCCKSLVMLK
jgi:hypothetical protein